MTGRWVQVTVAGDGGEAEEVQAMLRSAGIDSHVEPAVEHHPREIENQPQKVLVPETSLEDAMEAIEALSEPEELTGD
jgi:hypothetical protein